MLNIPMSPRIDKLREIYYNSAVFKEDLSYSRVRRQLLIYMREYLASKQRTTRLRKAHADAEILKQMKPVIDDQELIVGKADFSPLTEDEQKEFDLLRKCTSGMPQCLGIGGHMVLDYPKLLRVGVNGLLTEIREYRSKLDINTNPAENLEKDEFYEACEMELEGLLMLAKHYADHARELAAKEEDSIRAAELLRIAETLNTVPANPAQTFRQALQSIHFYHFCLWDGFHFGRTDQYLLPYYENDIKAGILTREDAQELIDCFRLIAVGYMTPESAVNCLVGGRDPNGNLVENELTEMFLTSVEHNRTMHKVEFAISKQTSEELLKYAIELNLKGFTLPSLLNDDIITEGMRIAGFSEEDSHNWANTGCVEITPIGKSGIFVVSPYHNMPKMLLEAMESNAGTLDELFDEFIKILRREIVLGLGIQNKYQLERSRNGKEVMRVSCLVDDCIKRGKSVDQGGAVYNQIQPNFLGLANTADSFTALDELVFKSGEYSLKQMREILAADFDGNDALRTHILRNIPHYGIDDPKADAMVERLTKAIVEACQGLKTFRGANLSPGCFSYIEHACHGLVTGATPDGRKAGYPLSSGSSPTQGRETKGPTAALLSATSWDHRPFLGGVAVNMKFTPNSLTESATENMMSLVRVFLERGGFELQINAASNEAMRQARKDPEKYRDLIVRVGGFSANFVKLSPEMQQELIDRNGHSL